MSKDKKFKIKTPEEIKTMWEGGQKLARVKEALFDGVQEGVSAYDVELMAVELIKKEGAQSSFKRVPGYKWATCINVNEGVVHGIPKKEIVFKKGDIVSVDCGVFYKGFHTDTSFSKGLNVDSETQKFIEAGKIALKKAMNEAKVGNRIYDISEKIETVIEGSGYTPIKALVGHGVGRELHEPPQIYCFTHGSREESPIIPEGAVLAIEVMYAQGGGNIGLEEDGWTISTSDGTISGLFEDTVSVTKNGPVILTQLGSELTGNKPLEGE